MTMLTVQQNPRHCRTHNGAACRQVECKRTHRQYQRLGVRMMGMGMGMEMGMGWGKAPTYCRCECSLSESIFLLCISGPCSKELCNCKCPGGPFSLFLLLGPSCFPTASGFVLIIIGQTRIFLLCVFETTHENVGATGTETKRYGIPLISPLPSRLPSPSPSIPIGVTIAIPNTVTAIETVAVTEAIDTADLPWNMKTME